MCFFFILGYKSYRNEEGSILIQEFVNVLNESGDFLGISDIFEHVIKEVRFKTRFVVLFEFF